MHHRFLCITIKSAQKSALKTSMHYVKKGGLGEFPLTRGTCITRCVSGQTPYGVWFSRK